MLKLLPSFKFGVDSKEWNESPVFDICNVEFLIVGFSIRQANLSHDYVYEYFAGTNRLKKVTDVYTPEVPESKVYNTNPLAADGKKYTMIAWIPYDKVRSTSMNLPAWVLFVGWSSQVVFCKGPKIIRLFFSDSCKCFEMIVGVTSRYKTY